MVVSAHHGVRSSWPPLTRRCKCYLFAGAIDLENQASTIDLLHCVLIECSDRQFLEVEQRAVEATSRKTKKGGGEVNRDAVTIELLAWAGSGEVFSRGTLPTQYVSKARSKEKASQPVVIVVGRFEEK